ELGCAWAPTVVAPVVLCPLGLAVSAVDAYVLSPLWDTLCLPVDAMKDFERPRARPPVGTPRAPDSPDSVP
ncbi:MAG: hypothetical protein ACI4Q3_10855, partial [Kiritimatiellia bacterium]